MGAYKHMKGLCPDLVEKARAYNYPDSSVCILNGDELELRTKYPNTYQNLLSCRHNRDSRTPFEYGQDLVASWLFEDFLMENLINSKLDVSSAGADKDREILPHTKVSSSSDCIVSSNGKRRPLELMCDYTGYWTKTGKMELRDAKFQKMQDSKSLFLGVSTTNNKYILLDMSEELESKFIPAYFLYGYKPAYSIKLPNASMKDLDFSQLASDIKKIL